MRPCQKRNDNIVPRQAVKCRLKRPPTIPVQQCIALYTIVGQRLTWTIMKMRTVCQAAVKIVRHGQSYIATSRYRVVCKTDSMIVAEHCIEAVVDKGTALASVCCLLCRPPFVDVVVHCDLVEWCLKLQYVLFFHVEDVFYMQSNYFFTNWRLRGTVCILLEVLLCYRNSCFALKTCLFKWWTFTET